MRNFKVYLSGPISGLDFKSAISWTDYAKDQLAVSHKDNSPTGIDGYRPLRNKEFLSDLGNLSEQGYDIHPLSTAKGIICRDYFDVRTSDAILVNLLGAKTRSIGTIAEISAAYVLNKPIVLVMEKEGNTHDHAFVTGPSNYWVHDLDIGIKIIQSILLP